MSPLRSRVATTRLAAELLLLCVCALWMLAGARSPKEWARVAEKDMEDVERQWADGDDPEELVDDAQVRHGRVRACDGQTVIGAAQARLQRIAKMREAPPEPDVIPT